MPGYWNAHSNFDWQPFIAAAQEMRDALTEALLQIEYLHAKFAATGTGEAVLARGRIALAKAVPPPGSVNLGERSNAESSPTNPTEES